MFSSALYSPRSASSGGVNAYRQVGVETGIGGASPHQLVVMLYDGALEAIARARGALRDNNVEAKGRAIRHASQIVEEGLKACLNMKEGGTLAAGLNDLYSYITVRLMQANLRNDDAALDECAKLIEPLRNGWAGIAGQVGTSSV